MKLPLASTVLGLLVGIAAVIFISPRTVEGAAFVLLFTVLIVTALGIAGGKLYGLIARKPPPAGPGGQKPAAD